MSLREYRRKRDFERTAEPAGTKVAHTSGRSFVVQKHAASRLHYDFRLELDGVLKSWAVPKGPSLDPAVKALAVQVEDHPIEYATFEGIIPEGEYGGGTVMVWDQGEWESEGDAAKALRQGKLKFALNGEKLKGNWSLVRMRDREASGDDRNWLLIKSQDEFARPKAEFDVAEESPTSVLTNRTMSEIGADADRVWSSNGKHASLKNSRRKSRKKSTSKASSRSAHSRSTRSAGKVRRPSAARLPKARKAPMPGELKPQLATASERVPEGEEWLHELKFDGYRVLCFLKGGDVRLMTRRGNDWTHRFPAIAEELSLLGMKGSILDGELVSLDSHGVSNFQQLQNWMKSGRKQGLVLYLFDVPYFEGYDLRRTPLSERKQLLEKLLLSRNPANEGSIRYSDHIQGHGPEVLKQSCERALEGIVSKLASSPYEDNRRPGSWLKIKCHGRQEFVIGGYSKPQRSRSHFGALLVGYYSPDGFTYCGRVGTGFTQETLEDLGDRLRKLKQSKSPFINTPTGARDRDVTWVKPVLVAEVEFSDWTTDGRLRQPSFQGLREDKAAKDVVRETGPARANGRVREATRTEREERMSSSGSSSVAGVALSNPDRVLYPEQQITKLQLAQYYEAVADWILPEVTNRPLTLVRCPRGREKQCFYQKHWTESLPDAVESIEIQEKDEKAQYVVIRNLKGLISLVQINVLELHPWGARTDRLERPDRLVFDLDPGPGVKWDDVKQAAVELRDIFEAIELQSFVRTTGGKGLHVVIPIARRTGWEEVAEFARAIATGMAEHQPRKYVANMRKNLREGRIFVDYLRNQRGATAIASYSTRARAGAPVATPLGWEQLKALEAANQFTIANVPERLESLKVDPWKELSAVKQSLTAKVQKAAASFASR